MPDITMCINGDCPLKEKCYRFRAKPSFRQSYSHFFGGKDCGLYWEIDPENPPGPINKLEDCWDKDKFDNNTKY